jgi:hypothetical protein
MTRTRKPNNSDYNIKKYFKPDAGAEPEAKKNWAQETSTSRDGENLNEYEKNYDRAQLQSAFYNDKCSLVTAKYASLHHKNFAKKVIHRKVLSSSRNRIEGLLSKKPVNLVPNKVKELLAKTAAQSYSGVEQAAVVGIVNEINSAHRTTVNNIRDQIKFDDCNSQSYMRILKYNGDGHIMRKDDHLAEKRRKNTNVLYRHSGVLAYKS